MARSKKGKPGYKGNIPASLIGKTGAMRTKLMILKGRKVEAEEQDLDTAEIDALIEQTEVDLKEADDAVAEAGRERTVPTGSEETKKQRRVA